MSTSSLNPGTVIRPTTTRAIVSVGFRNAVALLPGLRRARLEICYCSILDTCWVAATRQNYPLSVWSCPDRTRDQLDESL